MYLALILSAWGALHGDRLLMQPAQLAATPDGLPVDARGKDAFEIGHIPGAAHLDVDTLSETRNDVRGLLKPVDDVRMLVAMAGLAPENHLIVYAAGGELKAATRMLWILEYLGYPRVSVLDGGYEHWVATGTPPATGASDVRSVRVESLPKNVRSELLASKDEVKGGACALVDLRSGAEYTGDSKKDFVKESGHIPGAHSLPAGDLLQEGSPVFQPMGVIADQLKQQGAGDDTRVVTYCNTGRDATVGYFAYRLMDHNNVAVYDGSMAEWAQHEDVAQGDE